MRGAELRPAGRRPNIQTDLREESRRAADKRRVDTLHFDAASARVFERRYSDAYVALMKAQRWGSPSASKKGSQRIIGL
jgi:hypothetical protein